jgi:N-acylneuraminate cytidylyltransferase
MVKRIAIIPARGGSKRILNKNILDFNGKPMIAWTIIAAKKTKIFDRILVSTEDNKIASIAKKYGAEVPFFRKKYYDDISPVSIVTISALEEAMLHWKEFYKIVVQLMPNCPLRNSEDIKESLKIFEKKKRYFQISCFKFGWMNPWWSFKLNKKRKPRPLFPNLLNKRSQDLESLYCPTGAIWIADTDKLLKEKTFYGREHAFEPMNWSRAVDIDSYEDLDFAIFLKKYDSLNQALKKN